MSSTTDSRFVKQFTETNSDFREEDDSKAFNLNEIIDPKNIGKQKFTYDSDHSQNFDETNVKKASKGAKEILADAIEKAKIKAVQIREEARKLGYDEGHKKGFEKGEVHANQEFAPLFKVFEDHIRELDGFRRKMYGTVEREMIEMVVALTKKVIRHEFSNLEDSVQQMIRLAVESVLDKENMTIKVHPEDKDYAESFRPELHQLFDEIKNITFEASPALDRGGCAIETNFGTIDASLEHLNEQIEKALNSLIYHSRTVTPITFDDERTQFPKPEDDKTAPEKEARSETVEEEKPTAEVEGATEEDFSDIDDFEFPDLTDSDQQT